MRKTYHSPVVRAISFECLEDIGQTGFNIYSQPNPTDPLPQWSRKKDFNDYWYSEGKESPFPWEEEQAK